MRADQGTLPASRANVDNDLRVKQGLMYPSTTKAFLGDCPKPSGVASTAETLKVCDFSRWRFSVITVEHNYVSAKRNAIYDLLTTNGYTRVSTELAQCDDWYIRTAADDRS
jgi:hypothetical protein